MITPLSCSRITGSTCFDVRNTLFRFTSMIRCQFSSLRCVGPASPMPIPTLLCRMSIRPNCDRHASTIATQSTSRAASASNDDAVPPSPAIIDCVCRADSRSRSTSSTFAPSRANRIAVARPFPIVSPGVCPAPTTIATFPSSLTARTPLCRTRRAEASIEPKIRTHPRLPSLRRATFRPSKCLALDAPPHLRRPSSRSRWAPYGQTLQVCPPPPATATTHAPPERRPLPSSADSLCRGLSVGSPSARASLTQNPLTPSSSCTPSVFSAIDTT